jgi:Chaperone of endosialidase
MANQTLDNILFFSNGYGIMCANDSNHQIVIRGDRSGNAGDYTNYYQYSGVLINGHGHKFWGGGVIADQTLKFQIANDGNYMACPLLIGTTNFATYHPSFMSHAVDIVGSRPGISLENTSGTLSTIRLKGCATTSEMHINFEGNVAADSKLRFYAYGSTNADIFSIGLNGRIGIGTVAPSTKLEVSGDAATMSAINPTTARSNYIRFQNTADSTTAYFGLDGGGLVGADNGGTLVGSSAGKSVIFAPALSEKMRITSVGYVGINTTTPCVQLHVSGIALIRNGGTDTSGCRAAGLTVDIASCAYSGVDPQDVNRHVSLISYVDNRAVTLTLRNLSRGRSWDIVNEGTGNDKLLFNTFCSVGGYFNRVAIEGSTGNMGIGTCAPSYKLHINGTFYAAGSSQDYKQSICNYNTDSCMFMKLKPVTYQYKDEYKHLGKELKSETQIGLIAEEVAETYPELAILVKENDNDVVRNVDYEKLSIVLLAEVQKLRKEVDDLKTK